MALFSLEADMEGVVALHRDVPADLHGVQAGVTSCPDGGYG